MIFNRHTFALVAAVSTMTACSGLVAQDNKDKSKSAKADFASGDETAPTKQQTPVTKQTTSGKVSLTEPSSLASDAEGIKILIIDASSLPESRPEPLPPQDPMIAYSSTSSSPAVALTDDAMPVVGGPCTTPMPPPSCGQGPDQPERHHHHRHHVVEKFEDGYAPSSQIVLDGIPAGHYLVAVLFVDANGLPVEGGESFVDVEAGTTSPVDISLIPFVDDTGSISITMHEDLSQPAILPLPPVQPISPNTPPPTTPGMTTASNG